MTNTVHKPAAQTLKQRFGFMDEDLTSAKHDEIMLWLDQHLISVLVKFYPPAPLVGARSGTSTGELY